MKNKKFIYISGIFLVCLFIFLPKNVWAITDYNGDGIIDKDEKMRYMQETWGVNSFDELKNLWSDPNYIEAQKENGSENKANQTPSKKETPTPYYTSTVTKEPTCTEEGEKTYTSDLGDSYTEVIPALGHKPGDWTTEKEPTCTEEGKKVRYCTVCGEVVETMIIDKLPHTEGDWEVVQKPTLIKTGLKVKKCTICGEVLKEEVIPANTTLLYIIIGLSCAVLIGGVIGIITYKRRH